MGDLSWLGEMQTWIGFATLLVLEVVLGIDNLIFIAILADKVKPKDRDKARIVGLGLAIVIRLIMLGMMSYIITMKYPIFPNPITIKILGTVLFDGVINVSGKDLIMFAGGLFLLYKATTELHERLEGHDVLPQGQTSKKEHATLSNVIIQIVVLDAVFSLDSVITAVAMVQHIPIAMAAVVVAMGAMLWASKPLTLFVNRHPTVVMLCLGFLLMIGFSLLAEAFHFDIPKQYLYAAIGFSILIEVFNQISMKNRQATAATARGWRNRTADTVLGIMRVRESVLARDKHHTDGDSDDEELYEDNEKQMIRSVLTLAERPVLGVMTPRRDVERLDISQSKEQQIQQIQQSPFSRLVVIGKAGIDDPLGYVAKKDLLYQFIANNELDVTQAIRQPLVLPEITTVLDAMELFRKKTAAFAFVVDEFGDLLGILTMKDMLESIAGDFPEAYETPEERPLQENGDQSLMVDGSFEMALLAQEIGLALNGEEDVDYHSVAGLMIEELERIPEVGESIDYRGWHFEVVEKEGQRIERIKVSPSPEEQ